MMVQGFKEIPVNAQFADHLQPYQRLVELQKQMIELAQQNERTRQECAELRKRVAAEAITRTGPHRSLRQKANRALRKLPGMATAKSNRISLIIKEPSTC
jgi:regulator of replication initiation timing